VAQRRLARVATVVIALWIAIGIVAVVLFHWRGTHPPSRGKGEPIGVARAP